MPEHDEYTDVDTYDQYLTTQVLLPRGDRYEKETILRRKRNNDGMLVGRANPNPILDTRVFEVVFPDGHIAEYATNVIAENMFAMVDEEGYETAIIKSIIDHRCDPKKALSKQEAWTISHNGNRTPRYTTKGWDLCVEWCDRSSSWIPFKDLKVANPIETAEYAIAHNLSQEPAFSWWVEDVLRRRDSMIAASNMLYIK